MLEIVIKLLDQRSYSHMFYSQIITDDVVLQVGIVIKLLDQRSYSHMFYSQIITDDVRDSH